MHTKQWNIIRRFTDWFLRDYVDGRHNELVGN